MCPNRRLSGGGGRIMRAGILRSHLPTSGNGGRRPPVRGPDRGCVSSLFMVALGLVALLIVVLAGALILFLKWVEAGATSWLSFAFHTPSPRSPCAIGILI